MRNIHKVREMLAQIGGACVQLTIGCEEAQHQAFEVDVLLELEHALSELHKNAQQLVVAASSATIDPELDHDGDTQPNNEKPMRCGFVASSADGSRELVCQLELRHEGPHYAGPVAPLPDELEPSWKL